MMFDVQDEIVELLKGDPYFSDIKAIYSRRTGNVVQMVNIALGIEEPNAANQLGLAIIVGVGLMKIEHPNTPGPHFDEIVPVVSVLENVELNMDANVGIKKPSEDVAEYVMATLHQRQMDSTGTCLFCPRGVVLTEDPVHHGYDIPMRTQGRILYQPTQAADPVITIVGGNVTNITCATAGASIKWTKNGTRPTETNSLDFVFPVAVNVGDVVKARAYKGGLRASEISKQIA
jgi:hypothetical protein